MTARRLRLRSQREAHFLTTPVQPNALFRTKLMKLKASNVGGTIWWFCRIGCAGKKKSSGLLSLRLLITSFFVEHFTVERNFLAEAQSFRSDVEVVSLSQKRWKKHVKRPISALPLGLSQVFVWHKMYLEIGLLLFFCFVKHARWLFFYVDKAAASYFYQSLKKIKKINYTSS